ncbi:hypothetical protein BDE36_2066 [Arcticibacter tournemirensis]|uniref:Uncharacterized protein n=1 Tax=Arcticibacter tournemirensis TaxID=699437 RepID=A0A5M9HG61_9SPHI|nr:hypothetical protein [Arcticibacter tournemirensis]KAA8485385.1 hypothetical protein F1649_04515 [Arcticibacter tournemirensis]TQM50323.1 hypothetical protein BDE36_2066 [Arcticibacter tournemirensis]
MDFGDFSKFEQNFLNGKLGVFADKYVRMRIVWTPEQLSDDFLKHIEDELVADIIYLQNFNDNRRPGFNPIRSMEWLSSRRGHTWVLNKATTKYNKDKDVARRGSPIAERVRFGDSGTKMFYDINFGLQGPNSHSRVTTEEYRNIDLNPWTIKHVNHELQTKHGTDLKTILYNLPLNSSLVDITDHWLGNYYYDENNPALIPLLKTFRSTFYYYVYKGKYYASAESLGEDRFTPDSQYYQYGFDLCVLNFHQQQGAVFDIKDFTEEERPLKIILNQLANEAGIDYHAVSPNNLGVNADHFFTTYQNYFNSKHIS